jgi:hypothetical protein
VRAAAGERLRGEAGEREGEHARTRRRGRRQAPQPPHPGVPYAYPVLLHARSEAATDEIAVKAAL